MGSGVRAVSPSIRDVIALLANGAEGQARLFQRIGAAFFAVHDGDDTDDLGPHGAEFFDRFQRRAAGGDDVLQDDDGDAGAQRLVVLDEALRKFELRSDRKAGLNLGPLDTDRRSGSGSMGGDRVCARAPEEGRERTLGPQDGRIP